MPSEAERPVALVTGSNRGTGRAVAAALHGRGYRIRSLNRTPSGEDWLGELRCDLTDPRRIAACVTEAVAGAGRLDVCVANAVDRAFAPLAGLPAEDWDRLVAINLTSVFHLIRHTLPALRASGGLFVAMGSHAATRFFEGGAAYSATKAALKALVETLLLEERGNGVRACLVSPGAIANLDGDEAPYKMSTESVGDCVAAVIDGWPRDVVVGELEIRPARLPAPPVTGIDRLLHV
ncbi:SDR family NAD(P)-dependent oxidoreductase [Streptomyces sp. CSDS2]|uniref:SDR family oxidoreductase n=1 Tax=Streptomyces sp. CSDS2 TaxID=3055051 RepID=UPI0025B11435|nr:SDR family NAD(P)-dependent oxidoreductase [Streptomyces sp. CSDS2]MDN3258842.1 SDR family NAD(P)-dependent oxidoreductase [Streptomyces sp. CSDS2]